MTERGRGADVRSLPECWARSMGQPQSMGLAAVTRVATATTSWAAA